MKYLRGCSESYVSTSLPQRICFNHRRPLPIVVASDSPSPPDPVDPLLLSLESTRVVESVGEGVHEVVEGDTVIPTFLPDCGECIDCLSEKSNLCTKFPPRPSHGMERDDTRRFTDINGETLNHYLFVSSFSEYMVVDIIHVIKIDPAIPANRACLLGCRVSTGVGAEWKTAKVEAGTTVTIFGLGAIGLAVAERAMLCGAKRIVGVDVNQEKCEIGKNFGVTDFVNSSNIGDKTVSQIIIEMTDGGADYSCITIAVSYFYVVNAHFQTRIVVHNRDTHGKPLLALSADGRFDDEYFQQTKESSQFRNEYEMRKMKQDWGLEMISEDLDTS